MTTPTLADLQNICPICEAGTLTECATVSKVEYDGVEGFLDSLFSICSACGCEQTNNEQSRWNKKQMVEFKRRVDRYRTVTHWHCNGHTITCTRGHLSASVEAPILGSYTDARLWLSLLRYALTACEAKLFNLEIRGRL